MLAHVKTRRIEIKMEGDIPKKILSVLKELYGEKVIISADEYMSIEDTDWYKKVKKEMTPGDYMKIYRRNRKMTQTELGRELGGISKQNISHMERGTHGISKDTAKKLAKLFNVSPDVFI